MNGRLPVWAFGGLVVVITILIMASRGVWSSPAEVTLMYRALGSGSANVSYVTPEGIMQRSVDLPWSYTVFDGMTSGARAWMSVSGAGATGCNIMSDGATVIESPSGTCEVTIP